MYKHPSQQFNGVRHLKILGNIEPAARSAHKLGTVHKLLGISNGFSSAK